MFGYVRFCLFFWAMEHIRLTRSLRENVRILFPALPEERRSVDRLPAQISSILFVIYGCHAVSYLLVLNTCIFRNVQWQLSTIFKLKAADGKMSMPQKLLTACHQTGILSDTLNSFSRERKRKKVIGGWFTEQHFSSATSDFFPVLLLRFSQILISI